MDKGVTMIITSLGEAFLCCFEEGALTWLKWIYFDKSKTFIKKDTLLPRIFSINLLFLVAYHMAT